MKPIKLQEKYRLYLKCQRLPVGTIKCASELYLAFDEEAPDFCIRKDSDGLFTIYFADSYHGGPAIAPINLNDFQTDAVARYCQSKGIRTIMGWCYTKIPAKQLIGIIFDISEKASKMK